MGQLMVSIAGRAYRMACENGEEERVSRVAERLDHTIEDLRRRFGEVGDRRLVVMAGLTLTDTVEQQASRIDALTAEVRALRAGLDAVEAQRAAIERTFTTAVHETTEAIEALTRRLTEPDEDLDPV